MWTIANLLLIPGCHVYFAMVPDILLTSLLGLSCFVNKRNNMRKRDSMICPSSSDLHEKWHAGSSSHHWYRWVCIGTLKLGAGFHPDIEARYLKKEVRVLCMRSNLSEIVVRFLYRAFQHLNFNLWYCTISGRPWITSKTMSKQSVFGYTTTSYSQCYYTFYYCDFNQPVKQYSVSVL